MTGITGRVRSGEINKDSKLARPSTWSQEGRLGHLMKLPGLSVEFWAFVLADSHQDAAGWIRGLGGGRLQVPQRAVPLSILPGVGGGAVRTEESLCCSPGPPHWLQAS